MFRIGPLIGFIGLAMAVFSPSAVAPAHAESPAAICARVGTNDATRPVPESLAASVNAAFGTRMPAEVAAATTVFRCANGRVLVCTAGANLPCVKVNTTQAPGAGETAWCRDHPDAPFIPAYSTGHDTVYAWRCQDGVPKIARRVLDVDARGFAKQFWKELPP